MDLQEGIIDRVEDPEFLDRIAIAAHGARENGVQVIHVRVGFRPGHPEVDDRHPFFSKVKEAGRMVEGESSAFAAESSPEPGDIVVVKKRVSAFAGNDLEMILRAQGIEELAMAGVSTSGVVLSTSRAAADLDYRVTILSDGCADPDAGVQQLLMEKVFPAQARVVTIKDWAAGLPG